MRIFMLVPHPTARGPIARHTAHLVAGLRSLGCTVVTHPWGRRTEDESLVRKVVQRAQDTLSVRRALGTGDFDVTVVKTAHDWQTLIRDLAVLLAIRRRSRRVVLQLHGSHAGDLVEPGHHVFKRATAAVVALVDGLLVLSTEEQRQWQAFRRRPPVFTVKNPYVSAFTPATNTDRSPGPVPQVLFVGRLIAEKGVFELLDAFAEVVEQVNSELVLVGSGDQEQELRHRINRLGLTGKVTLGGYRSGSALEACYRAASVFALPSWSEGFPTVLAEAMDAGLPIVTTRIRGAADHLIAGENALFVEPRDTRGLSAALTTLLRDEDLRARMGSANSRRIRIFDPERVAAEYLEVLLSVAGPERAQAPVDAPTAA